MNTDLSFQYPHPPTSEEAIVAYEKELGFRLPEDYRQFLLKYNGGSRPNRSSFGYKLTDGRDTGGAVDVFFGLEIKEIYDLRTYQEDKQNAIEHLFEIGSALGDELGIGINGEIRGHVYIFEATRWGDVILLANSFNEFLDMLKSDG